MEREMEIASCLENKKRNHCYCGIESRIENCKIQVEIPPEMQRKNLKQNVLKITNIM